MVNKTINRGVEGKFFNNDRYNVPGCVPFALLGKIEIKIIHYLDFFTFSYNSASSFVLYQFFKIPYIYVFLQGLKQYAYNSRKLREQDRIALLNKLVEIRLGEPDLYRVYVSGGITVHDLAVATYGPRVTQHPAYEKTIEKLKMLLEALVNSSDVKLDDQHYRAEGNAINTIAEHDKENRRYWYQTVMNILMAISTTAIAVIAYLQLSGD